MGALPHVFPGYQPVDDRQTRARFEARYGTALPPHVGLKTTEYYEAAETGELRALLVMAMDPAATDPNLARARAAYSKLEFMAVMEIFMTDTAKLADVVFPAASFAEKEGTFTNAERRVQLFGKIIEPLKGTRPDWRILLDLAERMGAPMPFESPARIWDEVAELTPAFAGISHERLAREGGLCWPCPAPDHPGTPVMYEVNFPNGLARFSAPPASEPHESPDTQYPFTLITGRRLAHYNNGSMTRRSRGLMRVCAGETLDIHPSDARKLRLRDGGWARVSSRRGSVAARVKVTDETLEGRVFMSFHFPQTPVNFLTSEAVDAEAGTPEYKVTAVRVERMKHK
ncbi:MAG: molybdopterin-dependent oxidoreductase [Nitrospinae bacterium]|nr:molybdopterin-dependent oxidoreductase [Nitrospinota bacterium]